MKISILAQTVRAGVPKLLELASTFGILAEGRGHNQKKAAKKGRANIAVATGGGWSEPQNVSE